MGKVVECPAGQWTKLIDNLGSRMPATWTIDFQTAADELSGKVRQSRSFLPFGLAMAPDGELPLLASMVFQRYWSNASYRLEIYPDQDTVASFR